MQESTGKATAIDSLCIVSLRNRECWEPLFFSEYRHYETALFYEFALSFSSDTNCYFGWLIDLIDFSLSRLKGRIFILSHMRMPVHFAYMRQHHSDPNASHILIQATIFVLTFILIQAIKRRLWLTIQVHIQELLLKYWLLEKLIF